jgi:hypothetical protein
MASTRYQTSRSGRERVARDRRLLAGVRQTPEVDRRVARLAPDRRREHALAARHRPVQVGAARGTGAHTRQADPTGGVGLAERGGVTIVDRAVAVLVHLVAGLGVAGEAPRIELVTVVRRGRPVPVRILGPRDAAARHADVARGRARRAGPTRRIVDTGADDAAAQASARGHARRRRIHGRVGCVEERGVGPCVGTSVDRCVDRRVAPRDIAGAGVQHGWRAAARTARDQGRHSGPEERNEEGADARSGAQPHRAVSPKAAVTSTARSVRSLHHGRCSAGPSPVSSTTPIVWRGVPAVSHASSPPDRRGPHGSCSRGRTRWQAATGLL